MLSLLYMITDRYLKETDTEKYEFTERELTLESRKILDKIAVTILRMEIDNAIIINGLLKLSKMERMVIVLNILNDVAPPEIAFLLDTSINSVYVQKKNGLKKLRIELNEYFQCGILKYEEVEKYDAKNQHCH